MIFLAILGRGPRALRGWEFHKCLATNWEKQSNDNVSNFLQRESKITLKCLSIGTP